MSNDLEKRASQIRESIKGDLQTAVMLWDDTRPSQDVGHLLGSPLRIVAVTPGSMRLAQTSPEKAQVMGHFINALVPVDYTQIGRDRLIKGISNAYDFAYSGGEILTMLEVDLGSDQLGLAEPRDVHQNEQKRLAFAIKNGIIDMIRIIRPTFPSYETVKDRLDPISMDQFADSLVNFSGKLIPLVHIRSQRDPDIRRSVEDMRELVEWAKQYQERYGDTEFEKVKRLMEKLLPPVEPKAT